MVRRVWFWPDAGADGGGWCVRVHPVTGGRPLVCPVDHLREHYEEVLVMGEEEHEHIDVWTYTVPGGDECYWAWFCRCGGGGSLFESVREALRDCLEHIPSGAAT